MSADDFSWCDDPTIVVPQQAPIAVYCNEGGGITIRQQRDWYEEDDTIIAVTRANAEALAHALIKAAAEKIGASDG